MKFFFVVAKPNVPIFTQNHNQALGKNGFPFYKFRKISMNFFLVVAKLNTLCFYTIIIPMFSAKKKKDFHFTNSEKSH